MRLLLGLAAALAFSPAVSADTFDVNKSDIPRSSVERDFAHLSPLVNDIDAAWKRPTQVLLDNSPPTANYDFVLEFTYVWSWSGPLDVLANDTDPDLPNDTLTITGVSGSPYVSVSGNSLYFSGPPGSYALNYTIEDSHGLTSNADVDLYVSFCSDHECS